MNKVSMALLEIHFTVLDWMERDLVLFEDALARCANIWRVSVKNIF